MGIKKYYDTTKQQDKDGASPLVSLSDIFDLIDKCAKRWEIKDCKKIKVMSISNVVYVDELKKELCYSPKP